MQTVLIITKDKEKAVIYVKNLCKQNEIKPVDATIINFEKTVGIEDVRNFQAKLFLKPLQSKTKSVILNIHETLTDEAQNALLKVLEEPPNNTIIILIAKSSEVFLPTVLSRCKIIPLLKPNLGVEPLNNALYVNILTSLPNYGMGERLKLAQDNSKTKEDAKNFLENLILASRNLIVEDSKSPAPPNIPNQLLLLEILKSLVRTHTLVSATNANQRLLLENLFLSL